jgi:hypothetical protein
MRLKVWFRVIFAPFSSRAASCEPDHDEIDPNLP